MFVSLQIVEEHCSVEQSRRAQAEPISLDSCLKAFTSEEELGEDELYYCSKCKTHRLATKKLDLWRLPPILVGGRRFPHWLGDSGSILTGTMSHALTLRSST